MDREQPITNHLQELRRRLTISCGAIVITSGISFAFYKPLVRVLLRPADFDVTGANGAQLVFINVAEMLGVTVKVCLVTGVVLAFPIILYQAVMFAAPGLASRERRYLIAFLPASLICFASGVAFGYFVLFPPAINFLLSFGSDLATPTIRIGNYINVMVMLLFWMGIVFETPLVMLLLAKLRIVTSRGFARWRRHWFVVAFVLAALITPTIDPLNQVLVALPLIVLYEGGIWLSRLMVRENPQALRGIATSGR